MTTSPKSILAYASEDDRYSYLREQAIEAALDSDVRLILYDIDAAGSQAPLPTIWSAQGTREQFKDGILMPDQLEAAGRHGLAVQVQECIARGVETYGWLPEHGSVDALAHYADEQHASLIMVPAHADHASLLDRLRGKSFEHLDERTKRTVAVVEEDGTVELH